MVYLHFGIRINVLVGTREGRIIETTKKVAFQRSLLTNLLIMCCSMCSLYWELNFPSSAVSLLSYIGKGPGDTLWIQLAW